ncbi:hypothetical protein MMC28_009659 [Mycoblastus sanguinarius]|nr:hypothetical protein [Mycoblastus sanguinarius]
MAIEATPQLHEGANGAQAIVGVTLRNISIKSTMQAPTNEIGVETILDMHPVDLNYLKGSMEWYELSISSILSNGETWTKHCSGTIRVETYSNVRKNETLKIGGNAKVLSTARWYKTFAEVGLGCGPLFQGLSNVRAHDGENTTAADVALKAY